MTDNLSNEGKRRCDGCDELWPADHRCADEDSCPCRECIKRRMPPVALTPLEAAAVEWAKAHDAMMAAMERVTDTTGADAEAYRASVVAHMEAMNKLAAIARERMEDGR